MRTWRCRSNCEYRLSVYGSQPHRVRYVPHFEESDAENDLESNRYRSISELPAQVSGTGPEQVTRDTSYCALVSHWPAWVKCSVADFDTLIVAS